MSEFIEKELEVTKQKKEVVKTKKLERPNNTNFNKTATYSASSEFENNSSNQDPIAHQYDEYKVKPYVDLEYRVDNTINKSSLGPGLILKNMREEAKLSKEDVAKELRLSVRHVEYLENDQYDKFSALVFYLGNVRNYSRLLDLDADKMIAKFHAVYKVSSDNSTFKVVKVDGWQDVWPLKLFFSEEKPEHEKNRNLTILASSVVVTVVFILLWWFLSKSVLHNPKQDTISVLSNEEVQQLKPEQVDSLVPSSPVIVHNNKEGLVSAENVIKKSSSKVVAKKNKLDDYS